MVSRRREQRLQLPSWCSSQSLLPPCGKHGHTAAREILRVCHLLRPVFSLKYIGRRTLSNKSRNIRNNRNGLVHSSACRSSNCRVATDKCCVVLYVRQTPLGTTVTLKLRNDRESSPCCDCCLLHEYNFPGATRGGQGRHGRRSQV